MQTLRQDISYALRQMRLSPVFSLTAMLTLASSVRRCAAIRLNCGCLSNKSLW
jgi:hypothetical protein